MVRFGAHIRVRSLRIAAWVTVALAVAPVMESSAATKARPASLAPVEWSGDDLALDTLMGRSGKVLVRFLTAERASGVDILRRLFGDSAIARPGVYTAQPPAAPRPFSFVHLVPFTEKRNGAIGAYRVGFWPSERGGARSAAYDAPAGFIPVTPANQETRVSEHFRLRDFLTKDQFEVWPKYLVLREALLDKLELVIDQLHTRGLRADRMVVMSGFRTPQYNDRGVGAGGRSAVSRHQYGDAADVFVDNDGDGRMDDLNGDGRVNLKDATLLASVVDRVEQSHPMLVGGVGIYPATSAHGPFVHVDVRGVRARW